MILAPGRIGFNEGLPSVLDTALIAELLDVDQRTVRYWRSRGASVGGHRVYLKAIKAGGRLIRVAREDYIEFLRLTNPGIWEEVAKSQDAERKQAKRDHERLRRGKA